MVDHLKIYYLISKKFFFWTEEGDNSEKMRKRQKLPAAMTSPQMLQYFNKREDLMNAKYAEKEKKKNC